MKNAKIEVIRVNEDVIATSGSPCVWGNVKSTYSIGYFNKLSPETVDDEKAFCYNSPANNLQGFGSWSINTGSVFIDVNGNVIGTTTTSNDKQYFKSGYYYHSGSHNRVQYWVECGDPAHQPK